MSQTRSSVTEDSEARSQQMSPTNGTRVAGRLLGRASLMSQLFGSLESERTFQLLLDDEVPLLQPQSRWRRLSPH